jgi:cell division protease FtsH
MAGLMGGRAAEEIFIGQISTGASNDFQQATEIAQLMVREYGMSEELGPLSLTEPNRPAFLRSSGGGEGRQLSERTARVVDDETRRLTFEALERAREVLRHHRDKVESLAARLLATEVIEEEELRQLLGPKAHFARPLLTQGARHRKKGKQSLTRILRLEAGPGGRHGESSSWPQLRGT